MLRCLDRIDGDVDFLQQIAPLTRLAVFLLVAPIGGWAYLIAARYESLLFSAPWYAGVTSLQIVLMVVAFAVVRSCGFTFIRANASCELNPAARDA